MSERIKAIRVVTSRGYCDLCAEFATVGEVGDAVLCAGCVLSLAAGIVGCDLDVQAAPTEPPPAP